MGSYTSAFAVPNKTVKRLKPNSPKWIFKHAEAFEIPFLEVQRCWDRFVQLGADDRGLLRSAAVIEKFEDKFTLQFLRQLPWTSKGTLQFQTYLRICKWFQGADTETKVKVFYEVLNQSQAIDVTLLSRILKHVLSEETDEMLDKYAAALLEAADYKKLGVLDEEQFVALCMKLPSDELNEMLHFNLIPPELLTQEPLKLDSRPTSHLSV